MCDNMPMEKVAVTCPYCWWRGKRHPYRTTVKPCPRCNGIISEGWILRTCDAGKDVDNANT